MDIGKRIRELREERGLSQREVARRAGLTPSGVGFIEHGQTRKPSVETVMAIARALSVPVEELLEKPAVPLGESPPPVLDPWAMLAERDATRRAAALKAATAEERMRYVAELDAAVGRCDLALAQDTANPPDAEDEKRAYAARMRLLRQLRDNYVVLLNEAEPIAPVEPQVARMLVPA